MICIQYWGSRGATTRLTQYSSGKNLCHSQRWKSPKVIRRLKLTVVHTLEAAGNKVLGNYGRTILIIQI